MPWSHILAQNQCGSDYQIDCQFLSLDRKWPWLLLTGSLHLLECTQQLKMYCLCTQKGQAPSPWTVCQPALQTTLATVFKSFIIFNLFTKLMLWSLQKMHKRGNFKADWLQISPASYSTSLTLNALHSSNHSGKAKLLPQGFRNHVTESFKQWH